MKQLTMLRATWALLSFLLLTTACNDKLDPEIVKIPKSDATPPEVKWQITVADQTPKGPISSTAFYADDVTELKVRTKSTLKVELIGRDEQSGVRKLTYGFGFGYSCSPVLPGLSQSLNGIGAEKSVDFSKLTTHALKEWRVTV